MNLYKLTIPYIHNNFEHKLILTIEAKNRIDAYGQILEISGKLRDEGKNVGTVSINEVSNLEGLLSQITPENRHKEIDFGVEGRELL